MIKMQKEIVLNVIVRPEPEGGYSVVQPDLNVASQGDTFEEALVNIKEALELHFESAEEVGIMNSIVEQLGLTKADLESNIIVTHATTTSIPLEVSI